MAEIVDGYLMHGSIALAAGGDNVYWVKMYSVSRCPVGTEYGDGDVEVVVCLFHESCM